MPHPLQIPLLFNHNYYSHMDSYSNKLSFPLVTAMNKINVLRLNRCLELSTAVSVYQAGVVAGI